MPSPPEKKGGSGTKHRTARIGDPGDSEHRPAPPQIKPEETSSQPAHPCHISEILEKLEFVKLAHLLANGEAFKSAFIGSCGEPLYVHNKTRSLAECVESTWASIVDYNPFCERPYAMAVYDRDKGTQKSTWAGFDLDWHHKQVPDSCDLLAISKLWTAALAFYERGGCQALILERSGRGYHLWLISRESRPVKEWSRTLRVIMLEAGGENLPRLETFPNNVTSEGFGLALRLPGSVNVNRFNPRDGAPISTVQDTVGLRQLCASLPDPPSNIKSVYYGSGGERNTREKDRAKAEEREWLDNNVIHCPATRHVKARTLIASAACYRPEKEMLSLCSQLYLEASPHPKTSLSDHLKDCKAMLADWKTKLHTLFTPEERAAYDAFSKDDDRGRQAFDCLHNFHRLSLVQSKQDFAVSSEALGRAIGFSYKTALALLGTFVDKGVLRLSSPAIKRCRCARYAWRLNHFSAEEIKRLWPALLALTSNIKG